MAALALWGLPVHPCMATHKHNGIQWADTAPTIHLLLTVPPFHKGGAEREASGMQLSTSHVVTQAEEARGTQHNFSLKLPKQSLLAGKKMSMWMQEKE